MSDKVIKEGIVIGMLALALIFGLAACSGRQTEEVSLSYVPAFR